MYSQTPQARVARVASEALWRKVKKAAITATTSSCFDCNTMKALVVAPTMIGKQAELVRLALV